MGSPTGRGEHIPRAIFRGVAEHARRMGYPVASDDLFLLAVAELTEGTPARDVLESKGISVERLVTEISSRALPMPAESSGLMFPPAYNSMAGRAQAFAASLGDGPISPEHVKGTYSLIHHAATASYSWIRPPRTSIRRTSGTSADIGGSEVPAGVRRSRPRWGRWAL
jgi:hypothetical protein